MDLNLSLSNCDLTVLILFICKMEIMPFHNVVRIKQDKVCVLVFWPAIIKYLKVGGLNNRNLIVLQFWKLWVQYQVICKCWFFSEGCDNLFHAFLSSLRHSLFVDGVLLVSSHHLPLMRVCLCVHSFLYYKNTTVLD